MRMRLIALSVVAIGLAGAVEAQTLNTSFAPASVCAGGTVTMTVALTNTGGNSEADWQVENDPFLINQTGAGACTTDIGGCQVDSQSITTWEADPLPMGATSTSTIQMRVSPNAAPGTMLCAMTDAEVNSIVSGDLACLSVLEPCPQAAPAAGGWGLGIGLLAMMGIAFVARRRATAH